MNKILEAARLVAERKKAYDDRAQEIIDGMEGLDSKANQAFERPEGIMSAAEQDFKDLHAVFDEVLGITNAEKKDEEKKVDKKEATGSEDSSNSFPANQSSAAAS